MRIKNKIFKFSVIFFLTFFCNIYASDFELKISVKNTTFNVNHPVEILLTFENKSEKKLKIPNYPFNGSRKFIKVLIAKEEGSYSTLPKNPNVAFSYFRPSKKWFPLKSKEKIIAPIILFYNFKTEKFLFTAGNDYKIKIKFTHPNTNILYTSNTLKIHILKNVNNKMDKIRARIFSYSIFNENFSFFEAPRIRQIIEKEIKNKTSLRDNDLAQLWIQLVFAKYYYYQISKKYNGDDVLNVSSKILLQDQYYIESMKIFSACINSDSLYLQEQGKYYMSMLYASLKEWEKSNKMLTNMLAKHPWTVGNFNFFGFKRDLKKESLKFKLHLNKGK